jgi:hypothetical protein
MMTLNHCVPSLYGPPRSKHTVPSITFKKGKTIDMTLLPGPDRS